jgi:ribonuclease HI
MSEDPRALKLYIDGNAYKNPGGNAGMACVAEYPESWNRGEDEIFRVGFQASTNNRMELLACIRALEYVRDEVDPSKVPRVLIITDSFYVSENQNMPVTWRKNDWKTKAGTPVENQDLWRRFLSVRPACRIRTEIIWRKGKKTPIRKAVDKAAKAAGLTPSRVDRGFRQGKIGKSKIKGGSSTVFPATGQEQLIRVYKTAMVGKTGHKVIFDVVDEDTREFREKCRAYATAKLINELHRGHTYRVRFNDDSKNPLILAILEESQELSDVSDTI